MSTKMKKVYVQIVDTRSGIYQTGMIEEPVKEGLEIQNALAHFGVNYGHVKWFSSVNTAGDSVNSNIRSGIVEGTNKIVSIVTI